MAKLKKNNDVAKAMLAGVEGNGISPLSEEGAGVVRLAVEAPDPALSRWDFAITTPFANDGEYVNIPATTQSEDLNVATGFTKAYSQPLDQGGKAVPREGINGIFNRVEKALQEVQGKTPQVSKAVTDDGFDYTLTYMPSGDVVLNLWGAGDIPAGSGSAVGGNNITVNLPYSCVSEHSGYSCVLRPPVNAVSNRSSYVGQMSWSGVDKGASFTTSEGVWLKCDGSVKSKAAYPELASAVGNTWGAGTATNFYVPNMTDRVIRGSGTLAGNFGTYQEDALQNINGALAFYWGESHSSTGITYGATTYGALFMGSTYPSVPMTVLQTTGGGNCSGKDIIFDASRVARTSTETRVKSAVMYAYIFAGLMEGSYPTGSVACLVAQTPTSVTFHTPLYSKTEPIPYNVNLTLLGDIGAYPNTPQNLRVSYGVNQRPMLNWEAPAGGAAVVSYNVYSSAYAESGFVLRANITNLADLSWEDTEEVTSSQMRYYKIAAVSAVGEGFFTPPALGYILLNPVAASTVTVEFNRATIKFNPAPIFAGAVIEQSVNGGAWTQAGKVSGGVSSLALILTSAGAYIFRYKYLIDGVISSNYSGSSVPISSPTNPTILPSATVSLNRGVVNFSPAPSYAATIVEQSLNGGAWTQAGKVSGGVASLALTLATGTYVFRYKYLIDNAISTAYTGASNPIYSSSAPYQLAGSSSGIYKSNNGGNNWWLV